MNRARRIAGFIAVAGGLFAVALLGGPVAPLAFIAVGLCAAGPWLSPRLASAPWPILTLAILVGIGGWVGLGAEPRSALGVALVYLQVHRVLARTGPADDRVSLLLAGLMLVAAASASEDLAWLGAFAVWLVAAPVAMLPAGFRGDSRSVGRIYIGLVLAAVALAVLMFPLMPRFRADTTDESLALTGFSGQVELGALDVLLDDPGEVFSVDADPSFPQTPLYYRGAALDTFDGRVWTSGSTGDRSVSQPPAEWPAESVVLRFAGVPPEGVLFTAGKVRDVYAGGRAIRRDRHGAYRLDQPVDQPIEWVVVADGPWGPGSRLGGEDPRPDAYLQLPRDLDPRIEELARSIAGDLKDPRRVADAIADYLRANADYSRAPRDAGAEAPLPTFLFDRRSGHCEYFASAQAVLLRSLGIRARVVNGFVGGEVNPLGSGRLIRRYHAHAWAEVYVPKAGWVLIDATPGPGAPDARSWPRVVAERVETWWKETVLEFDRTHQQAALWSAGAVVQGAITPTQPDPRRLPWGGLAVIWGLGLVFALAADRVLRRLGAQLAGESPKAPRGPVERAWRKARSSMEAAGFFAPASMPPLSAARHLGEALPAVAEPLEELAWLHYRVRHGGEDSGAHVERANALARTVVQGASARATP